MPSILRRSHAFHTSRGFQQVLPLAGSAKGKILAVMYRLTVASVLIILYSIDLTLTALPFTLGQSSTSQLLRFNTTLNATLPDPAPNPSYEVYDIPASDLRLHLTLLLTLDHLAMQSCLQTASIWVGYQRQSGIIPHVGFEWKDPAGAVFYIRSLSRHLTWADLKTVLRGFKEDLEDQHRYLTTSFTVEQKSTQLFIAQGRLSRYKPPEPTLYAMTDKAAP